MTTANTSKALSTFLELHSPPEGAPSLKLVSVHDRRGGWGDPLPVCRREMGFQGKEAGKPAHLKPGMCSSGSK